MSKIHALFRRASDMSRVLRRRGPTAATKSGARDVMEASSTHRSSPTAATNSCDTNSATTIVPPWLADGLHVSIPTSTGGCGHSAAKRALIAFRRTDPNGDPNMAL
jgi:hypothetical protein